MIVNFKQRSKRPSTSNLEFRTSRYAGGWSQCIQGEPTDSACDVLANCVGYACGRFNEIYNEITGNIGMRYPQLNCNAENFIRRAREVYPDLIISSTPVPGSIIVWEGKGSLAGHVAVVEDVIDLNTIKTSESAYGGSAFYVSTRTNDNGRWGMNSNYSLNGFILNPVVTSYVIKPVERDTSVDQVNVQATKLRIRTTPSLSGDILGFCELGYFNVLAQKEADDYIWFEIEEDRWIAQVDDVTFYKKEETDLDKLRKKIKVLEQENKDLKEKIEKIRSIL